MRQSVKVATRNVLVVKKKRTDSIPAYEGMHKKWNSRKIECSTELRIAGSKVSPT